MEKVVGVVCHDAGGANLVARICQKNRGNYRFYLKGPSVDIFRKVLGVESEDNLEKFTNECFSFLCGTSGRSNLERLIIKKAQILRKYSTAVLDHWINYEDRFCEGTDKFLPNEIIVVDEYAYKKAKSTFPSTTITLIENLYIKEFTKLYKEQRKLSHTVRNCGILYLSEGFDEFRSSKFGAQSLDLEFFKKFVSIKERYFGLESEIIVRLHPSEALGKIEKYREIIPNLSQSNLSIELYKELCNINKVVGISSMGLVLSASCDIPTFSLLRNSTESQIPVPGIDYLGI